jgi:hypothetical protein
MSEKNNPLEKQQQEDAARTAEWIRDQQRRSHVNDQQPEDPKRTQEWNRAKKPEKK